MEENKQNSRKKDIVKSICYILIALVLLVSISGLAEIAGVFDDIGGIVGVIHLNKDIVLKLLIMIMFVIFTNNIILVILKVLLRGKRARTRTLATVISSLVKYTAVIVGGCWGLSIIGINVSTIFASIGVFALILGFGAESLVADLVTGIFILFENQYNVGDIIEVDGYRGVVQEIGIRTTSIKDVGDNVRIMNNSNLKNIINRSNLKSVTVCDVGVSYKTDLEVLEDKLKVILPDIQNRNSDVFIGKIQYVGVESLAESSVVLRFVADVREENIYSGRRLLNRELKIAFDKAGIHIAYPQLDIHTVNEGGPT